MSPSRLFILRPVATTLLMVGLLLVGLVAYRQLPVSALPEVDYPTIQVVTFYPGADSEVMASSVTAPLERQFGQVPGLSQMTSTSSFGSSLIILQFNLDQNIDVAEQQVQAAINAATTYLPRDLPNPPIYSKVNPADSPILTLALTSDTLPLTKVEDLADTTLAQKISQLPGVGLVSISGGQKPAVRIQANPTALASYGLSLEDLRTVLGQANVDQAKGVLDGPRQSYTINANDQLFSSSEYRDVIVTAKNGAPVRLSDVANVIDGAENARQAAWMNLTPAVIVNIQRQPGANIISVADRIKKLLPRLQSSLPSSIKLTILTDRTQTIRASVDDVQFEMLLTIGLVVMVIFLFLRNLPATVIPSVAVPLSLVGTFGVMYLLGYSLNNLTLMALTISTGFVVDDAIVMIENIDRYLEEGDSPLDAALKGAGQIGFTIVSLTVSLIAVLIPLPRHWCDSGNLGRAANHLVRCHGTTPTGPRADDSQGSRRRESLLVHWDRWSEHYAQQRPYPDQSQAAQPAQGKCLRYYPPLAARTGESGWHHALHAARSGFDSRGSRQPHSISVLTGVCRRQRLERLGATTHGEVERATGIA